MRLALRCRFWAGFASFRVPYPSKTSTNGESVPWYATQVGAAPWSCAHRRAWARIGACGFIRDDALRRASWRAQGHAACVFFVRLRATRSVRPAGIVAGLRSRHRLSCVGRHVCLRLVRTILANAFRQSARRRSAHVCRRPPYATPLPASRTCDIVRCALRAVAGQRKTFPRTLSALPTLALSPCRRFLIALQPRSCVFRPLRLPSCVRRRSRGSGRRRRRRGRRAWLPD